MTTGDIIPTPEMVDLTVVFEQHDFLLRTTLWKLIFTGIEGDSKGLLTNTHSVPNKRRNFAFNTKCVVVNQLHPYRTQ